ncbi:Fanconi anemia group I protein [Teleopsis dalmanni]|uniref:Fanconi anemia group I protein n=1 Tax=Teleopsis dalmanni TaxID=139649 RepID=UPI0018CDCDBF|nr:Fanconi anemia group I protein [Teleopsis dalmanni]
MNNKSLEAKIISFGEKNNLEELQNIIKKTSAKELTVVLKAKFGRNDCTSFWNYLLQSFDLNNFEAKEKRFACVKCFLDGLLNVELSTKQTYDLITRLCQDLNTFDNNELIDILEHSLDSLRTGDPKCVGWKDLLPETLNILAEQPRLSVNAISMSGAEYRQQTVQNLTTMRWPKEVLTPVAAMFRNLNLTNTETVLILNKFSGVIQSVSPMELPALSYQLFFMCKTASEIIIPIIGLEKYFHRYYYKKLFADMNSNSTDFDSIDEFSDKELREAEETILHHLNYCTQYKMSEQQVIIALKNFQCMPDTILTPFVISAILTMASANRDPDAHQSMFTLLQFLRGVIRCNEDERNLADYSVWCRDTLQRKQVDLDQIFNVLIDRNKDGKDIITPGLLNLVFVLLKTKNALTLHSLAIGFLTRFIRKRFVFGQGIVEKIAKWLVVEQDQYQYSECLTLLSVADTYTVSECLTTIKYVMGFFLSLPAEQSMRMMGFILPVLKLSAQVRDAFIDELRKAINSSSVKIRRMAVYGFCMVLKQLNVNNSHRSQLSGVSSCTQHSISGLSLMSQAILSSHSGGQRNFDMLTLEIIGLLSKCFNENLEIKITLYENLQRAVELNGKLSPHIIQFIDWHFRSFFDENTNDEDITTFTVQFDCIVRSQEEDENVVIVKDNLGSLILFLSHALIVFEKFESYYDVRPIKRLLNLSVENVIAKALNLEMNTPNSSYKNEIVAQQINFIEGLIAYMVLTSQQTNDNAKKLSSLFREHQRLIDLLKTSSSKKSNKAKVSNDSEATTINISGNNAGSKKANTGAKNIWDLAIVEKCLRLLHEDIVPFASSANTSSLRSNPLIVRYVLEVATLKVEGIRLEPVYKQLAHSKRTLKYLTDITKVVYERCIKRLADLSQNFDEKSAVLAAECFKECIITANTVYKAKFNDNFIRGLEFCSASHAEQIIATLHKTVDHFMQENAATQQEKNKEPIAQKLVCALLQSLEVLYDNLSFSDRMTTESYTWLMNFCKKYEVQTKELSLIHKLLFTQRQKTHSGAFFNKIAHQLGKIIGTMDEEEDEDEDEGPTQNTYKLKSITSSSFESCFVYLCAAVRKQIENVDYFILKANNSSYKIRIIPEEDRDVNLAALRKLERSICSQLMHISQTLLKLTNITIPLGVCMDTLLKLLMQHFICLKNLTKHFLSCGMTTKHSVQNAKFDALVHAMGRSLPKNIYELITYLEANILGSEREHKKSNPQSEKSKVLRETKLVPKVILCVENFNKHVILLAKKTNDRLASFLHIGSVHDFRINTKRLKEAIERTLSHSSDIETVGSEQYESEETNIYEEDMTDDNDNEEEEENSEADADVETTVKKTVEKPIKKTTEKSNKNVKTKKNVPSRKQSSDNDKKKQSNTQANKKTTGRQTKRSSTDNQDNNEEDCITPDNAIILENESDRNSVSQLMKNVEKINKKAKKRTLRELENNDADVRSITPEPKIRRGRSSKK